MDNRLAIVDFVYMTQNNNNNNVYFKRETVSRRSVDDSVAADSCLKFHKWYKVMKEKLEGGAVRE